MKIIIQLLIVSISISFFSQKICAQKLAAIPYVSGINSPIDLKNCGDDRLFVADRAGRIRVINGDGTLRPVPFLNITTKISSNNSEEGFLGIAFSPDYKTSGKFYVDYTSIIAGKLTSVIEEYKVSAADSNVADPASALKIITQVQPFSNHNGGNLMFGKDGFLYINFGDGGSGGDPFGNGQNKKTLLGKILRVDVSNSSASQPYVVPSSNPFYSDTTSGIKKEIWIYGVRNPFRCSVDRLTGDLLIADVGQNKVEEIDFQNANDAGGKNYGWNIVEGDSCYNPASGCNKKGITMPIYEYFHNGGSAAIIGGYVYRSAQSKSLWGQYLFTDEVLKFLDAFHLENGMVSGSVNHLITAAQAKGNPVSFGEDKYGDQYIIFYGNGTVYKLQDTSYLRRPKAYVTSNNLGAGSFLLQALEGKNLTYQWLKDNMPVPGAVSSMYTTSVLGSYTLEVTNSLGFKDTSDAFLLGTSIDLISFAAQKNSGSTIVLNWQTGSELNISGFTIQRRKNNETVFSDIGFVSSKAMNGFSNTMLSYNFIDSSALNYSKLFYRLQILHADSSFNYSDTRYLNIEVQTNGFLLFPNPASHIINIYLNQVTDPVFVKLYDLTGKEFLSQILDQQNCILKLPFSKGIYIIQISDLKGKNPVRKKLLVD
ncbi:MAG: PQQ-dependent sugar dehydrogenase [Ginsengibacter sp.]